MNPQTRTKFTRLIGKVTEFSSSGATALLRARPPHCWYFWIRSS